jgi:hypothetical protein
MPGSRARPRTTAAKAPKIPKVPLQRSKFTELLVAKSPLLGEAGGDTTYEQLGCIGYDPAKGLLEAAVAIKLPTGYGGGLCGGGSTEYVRFYVDFGSGFQDAGLASFAAHDLPNSTDHEGDPTKPLTYVVTLAYDPPETPCSRPQLPVVRAILSWNNPPPSGQPDWTPFWGDVKECAIQIAPGFLGPLEWVEEILAKAGVEPEFEIELPPELELVLPTKKPKPPKPGPGPDPGPEYAWPSEAPALTLPKAQPLPIAELHALYGAKPKGKAAKEKAVSASRFALPALQPLHASPQALELTDALTAEFAAVGLDLSKIAAELAEVDADTAYEQLECVGLDPNLERLVATFRIKLPFGYGGQLCWPGSTEYVAFWADWDDTGTWEHVGTVEVNVHDFSPIPSGGICYSAVLPVDLTTHRRPCTQPKLARVRAVLSWAVPPSTTDPDALTYYGNRLDAHVQINPGPIITGPQAVIAILGGIPVGKIDSTTGETTPSAFFAINNIPPDAAGRPCRFGARVNVIGPQWPGYAYRVSVRRVGQVAWTPVTTPFTMTDWTGTVFTLQSPGPGGWFTYVPFTQNITGLLALWDTAGEDKWEVQLELADTSAAHNVLSTTSHVIRLDNTPPAVSLSITGGNCGRFNKPVTITGTFSATDDNFGSFSIWTSPFAAPSGALAPTGGSLPVPAGSWSLQTTNMQVCGYTINISAIDRAILNSAWVGHWAWEAQGFCLE